MDLLLLARCVEDAEGAQEVGHEAHQRHDKAEAEVEEHCGYGRRTTAHDGLGRWGFSDSLKAPMPMRPNAEEPLMLRGPRHCNY